MSNILLLQILVDFQFIIYSKLTLDNCKMLTVYDANWKKVTDSLNKHVLISNTKYMMSTSHLPTILLSVVAISLAKTKMIVLCRENSP